jgi:cellulose synthase/poly-beta-1,6-N-acetylglucosamine synthase-like glycosyltransferase
VSVVIPSLTGDVARARASLDRQTVTDWELCVVTGVRPAGRARNSGVAQTTADLILFLDDDAEFGHERVLEAMLAEMTSPDIAVVGSSRVLPPTNTSLQRRIMREVARWESPILNASLESNPPLDRYGFSEATTTCCLVRRSALLEVGGFNEGLSTGEDPELFYRLRRAGYRFIVPAQAWTYHAPPAGLGRFLVKCFHYGAGHAQEARLEPSRGMEFVPSGRASALLLMVSAPVLLVPMMFVDVQTQPRRRIRLGFRPLQALARVATMYGYAWASWAHRD